MKKYLFVLSALVLLAFGSCKKISGDPITKSFDVTDNYTTLDVCDAFNVTVCDTISQVIVTIGENLMPKVVVEVADNNTLKIYLKPFTVLNDAENTVLIPYNANLHEVALSGAADFRSEFPITGDEVHVIMTGASDFNCDIEADKIEMYLSGASNIKGNVAATDLDLDMTGASDATLKGRVTTLDIDLSGASNIKKAINGSKYALECDFCNGVMTGSSNAYIHCDGTIKVSLSGGSELHFTGAGNPADSNCSGGSEIVHDVL